MEKIKLINRDGASLYLENCDDNLWELKVDDKHKYVLEFMRIGYKSDNRTIDFIDPSGGPYLSIGQRINKNFIIGSIIEVDGHIKINLIEREV